MEPMLYTLTDLLDAYEQDYLPLKSPSTQYQERLIFARFRLTFGEMLLTDLTPAYLRQWRQALLAHYTPKTVNRYLAALSGPLTAAVDEYEWLAVQPLSRVRKPPEPPGRVRFLSPEERNALLIACRLSKNLHLYLVVVVALSTGGRKMEVLSLRWQDIDLQQGVVRFNQTKNKERRTVPLITGALKLLQKRCQQGRPHGWVFPRSDGRLPVKIESAWQVAKRRAGLRDFRFHDLRHTAASYLAMSGASVRDIAEILGHKTLKMAMRYIHLSVEHTSKVVHRMAAEFLPEDL